MASLEGEGFGKVREVPRGDSRTVEFGIVEGGEACRRFRRRVVALELGEVAGGGEDFAGVVEDTEDPLLRRKGRRDIVSEIGGSDISTGDCLPEMRLGQRRERSGIGRGFSGVLRRRIWLPRRVTEDEVAAELAGEFAKHGGDFVFQHAGDEPFVAFRPKGGECGDGEGKRESVGRFAGFKAVGEGELEAGAGVAFAEAVGEIVGRDGRCVGTEEVGFVHEEEAWGGFFRCGDARRSNWVPFLNVRAECGRP